MKIFFSRLYGYNTYFRYFLTIKENKQHLKKAFGGCSNHSNIVCNRHCSLWRALSQLERFRWCPNTRRSDIMKKESRQSRCWTVCMKFWNSQSQPIALKFYLSLPVQVWGRTAVLEGRVWPQNPGRCPVVSGLSSQVTAAAFFLISPLLGLGDDFYFYFF